MSRPAHCACPPRGTDPHPIRRYRIEYRPVDGWCILGEPILTDLEERRGHKPGEWPHLATVATRELAERRVAEWQARHLILLGVDLNAPANPRRSR